MAYYFFDDISVTEIPSCISGELNCTAGITEDEKAKLKIYPNPVSNNLYIEHGLSGVTFEISDIMGTSLVKQNIAPGITKLNLEWLPGGIYFGQYQNNKHYEVIKIIKQ